MKQGEHIHGQPGSMDPESDPEPGTVEYFYDTTRGEILLWTGTLGAPALWLIQFQFNYSLVQWSCRTGNIWVLYMATVAFFVLALGAGGLSYWNWTRIGRTWPGSEDEGIPARTRLLAILGILTGVLFAAVIGAQGLAYLFFSPCEF